MPLRREESGTLRYEGEARGGEFSGSAPAPTFEELVLAEVVAAGASSAFFPFLADHLVVGVGDKVSLATNLDTGGDAAQAVDAARPVFSLTAVNGKPGLLFSSAQVLQTAAIDTGLATWYAVICLFSDTDGASRFVIGFGGVADEALMLNTNAAGAGNLDTFADGLAGGGALTSRARSSNLFAMVTPAVVTSTWDTDLATNETEIRHAGANVTNTRPNNGNNTGGLGSQILTIGARETVPTGHFAGAMGSVQLLWGTGGVPLTQIANIEKLLNEQWCLEAFADGFSDGFGV